MRGFSINLGRLSVMTACAAALLGAQPALAQTTSYAGYAETPSAALVRHIHTLASDPKDFSALIGAGKASLEIGDPQAAAGFFARADEVNPRSPLPHAGMGAVSVASGDPRSAMPYFSRALQLGAPVSTIACERGLAYDLLGQQRQAQADYRIALNGPDATEARRRLALSLAISGDKAKTQTYCDIGKLNEQIEEADEKKDVKKTEELSQQIDALGKKLGPEYAALVDGLQDIDPQSEVGQEISSTLDALDNLCGG